MPVFTALKGAGYAQRQPAKPTEYLGACLDADALPNSKGSRDPIQCYDQYGRWITRGKTRTPPEKNTTVLTGLLDQAVTKLEQYAEVDCSFVFYASLNECTPRGSGLANGVKVYGYEDTTITDETIADWMMRTDDNPTTDAFSLEMMPGRIDMRIPVTMELTTDSDQDMLALAIRDYRCANSCGEQILPGDEAIFGGGDGVAAPDVQGLVGGSINPTDLVAMPFVAGENVLSMVRFQVDRNTERYLAVRDGDAANPLEVSYTDDGGATAWVDVVVGATVNEAAQGPQALFALDYAHIWLVTDTGNIWFSSDGGLTWTLQLAGTSLYAVHFADAFYGYAVGAADEMYFTNNGGATWTTLTGTGGAGDLLTVQTFGNLRAIVGTDDGDIWYTWDGGATWTQLVDFGTGTVPRISYWSDLRGYAIFNTAAPVGSVHMTNDGGYSWQTLVVPANLGLNDIEAASDNFFYVAGNIGAGATPILIKAVG